MALQTSGLITLQDIQAEFGGATSPIALQNYYRGGALVPNTSTNSGVPTSGVIGAQDFYGAAAFAVTLTSYSRTGGNFSSGPCSAGVSVRRDGNVSAGSSNASTVPTLTAVGGTPNQWADPPSGTIGDGYHVRYLTSSGSASSGTANAWLALTSDRSLFVSANNNSTASWAGRIQISEDGGSTVLAQSDVFTLTAESSQ